MTFLPEAPGAGIARRLKSHFAARRTWREIQSLEPHVLRDIGLNPDAIHGVDIHSQAARHLLGGR